jgi:uncharacterized NAD(P)/FAD-binding protein YdhS
MQNEKNQNECMVLIPSTRMWLRRMKMILVSTTIEVVDRKKRKIVEMPKELRTKIEKEIQFLRDVNRFFDKLQNTDLSSEDNNNIFREYTDKLFENYEANKRKTIVYDVEKNKRMKILQFEFVKKISEDVNITYEVMVREV